MRALALLAAALAACSPSAAGTPDAGSAAPDAGSHDGPPTLSLVSARDHISDAFLSARTVWADRERIYLAGNSGTLHVLARDRARDFPVVEEVHVADVALTSVRGDGTRLYVSAADGTVYVFTPGTPLKPLQTKAVSRYSLSSLERAGDTLFVGLGQVNFAVDAHHVFFTRLNEGEDLLALDPVTLETRQTYAPPVQPDKTLVLDRADGRQLLAIDDPTDVRGNTAFPVLFALPGAFAMSVAGCCGAQVTLYDAATSAPLYTVFRPFVNAVAQKGERLVLGTEAGSVAWIDRGVDAVPDAQLLDLKAITGHTRDEDVEIRALWTDDVDDLVFAGSSWGNDRTRGPELPSFFVLELK